MNASAPEPRALAQQGLQALRAGDARTARQLLERYLARSPGDAMGWVALAHACGALDDANGRLAALERALALQPRNLHALVMKGDHYASRGDGRAASTFYQAAIDAAPPAGQVPPDVRTLLDHARAMCARYDSAYESHLMERLGAAGFDRLRSSRRFARSLDIMLGRGQVFHQQPTRYYFPGLPQIEFYEREVFPWLAAIEAATDEIRAELLGVMREDTAFKPYVEPSETALYRHELVGNPSWSAFFIWKNGALVRENAARCPRTTEIVRAAPLPMCEGKTPSVLFSLLKPGTRIPPHHGMLNTRLICHLPLIVPARCALRVGGETRQWTLGQALVFDDSIEHEAWNESGETRVVLLFDVWRPELTEEERGLVTALLAAVQHFGAES